MVIGAGPAGPLEHPGRERLHKDGPIRHGFALLSAARACGATTPAVPCHPPTAMIVPVSNEKPATDCANWRFESAFMLTNMSANPRNGKSLPSRVCRDVQSGKITDEGSKEAQDVLPNFWLSRYDRRTKPLKSFTSSLHY